MSRNPKTRKGKSVLRPNHTSGLNFFSTSYGIFLNCQGLPVLNLLGLFSIGPQIHPAEGNVHPAGNNSEVHSLAGGVISTNCLGREKLTHGNKIKSVEN